MPPTTPQDRRPAKKTTSRRTAKKAAPAQVEVVTVDPDDKYAPTTWGSQLGGAEDLVVPSGQTCLAKRPGVQGLMEAGILHDLDMLSGIVDEKHVKRVNGKPQIDVADLAKNPDQITSVLHLVDRVVCHVVLKPSIHMTPNDPTTRVKGAIYADMVDIVDKMFIFNFAVGGVRGLEPFREQLEEALGSMGADQATSPTS